MEPFWVKSNSLPLIFTTRVICTHAKGNCSYYTKPSALFTSGTTFGGDGIACLSLPNLAKPR